MGTLEVGREVDGRKVDGNMVGALVGDAEHLNTSATKYTPVPCVPPTWQDME